jgi:hypothetical protein
MFSHCSVDGIHIKAFNYMLFFDNFYSFDNGVYGIYAEGTNSGFSNFEIERNGTAGIHVDGANDRFTSGEVIWNGSTISSEAGMYVSGFRNIITAVETENNYTSGFSDSGNDNEFIGCVSDSNGYVQRNTSASSRSASGFVLKGTGGVYVGDKVTSYRGRLPDGNFTTEWPYHRESTPVDHRHQLRQYKQTGAYDCQFIAGHAVFCFGQSHLHQVAWPPVAIGFCSTKISSSGSCVCN